METVVPVERPSRGLLGPGLFVGVAVVVANALNAVFQVALARILDPAEYSLLVALVVVTLIAAVPPLAFQASVAREVAVALAEERPRSCGRRDPGHGARARPVGARDPRSRRARLPAARRDRPRRRGRDVRDRGDDLGGAGDPGGLGRSPGRAPLRRPRDRAPDLRRHAARRRRSGSASPAATRPR